MIWNQVIAEIQRLKNRFDQMNQEQRLARRTQERYRRFREAFNNLKNLIPRGSPLAEEVALTQAYFGSCTIPSESQDLFDEKISKTLNVAT
jgi:Tfp pilus assembly protein PilN